VTLTWNWPIRFVPAHRRTTKSRRPTLTLEWLEQREVPAITILFDYSLDTAGFFSDPNRRAVLQQAADDISSHLNASLGAIIPGGQNSFSESFFNPADGQVTSVQNRAIPANTLLIYAGGRALTGNEAGIGGYGGYGASGTQDWLNYLHARGVGGATIWGGSLTFDTTTNWFVGTDTAGLSGNQVDFYSVATHELGHLLGIGTLPTWFSQVSSGTFHGPHADAAYGGAVPVYGDSAHWADGLTVNGQRASLDPILPMGQRVPFSSLDYAALIDLGWVVSDGTSPVVPPAPPPAPPPVVVPPLGNPGTSPVILTGPPDGSAQAFTLNANGQLVLNGNRMYPFPGFTGVIRTTVADFNGDGTADYAFATGAGTAARVRIIDGKTGDDLAPATTVLDGFAGGVFLAAADIDRDGKAELAVSADAGGGTRVSLYKLDGSGLHRAADFLAFGDPSFRGGSRVALGDVNRDGAADLIVGAGIGGGPRVAIYSGTSLLAGRAERLVPDFFALDPSLRSGVFVTTADLDGDGYADVIYSTGNTGGPRVRVVSGSVLSANPGRDAYFLPAMADFFAFDANDRNGVRIAARDLNGDGKAELVVAGGDRANPVVRVFSYPNLGSPNAPYTDPFADPLMVDGVYVG
jgi:hypothetical protein